MPCKRPLFRGENFADKTKNKYEPIYSIRFKKEIRQSQFQNVFETVFQDHTEALKTMIWFLYLQTRFSQRESFRDTRMEGP